MKLQKTLFKIYLFLMPFMLLPGLSYIKEKYVTNAYVSNSLFVMMLGLCLIFLLRGGKIPYARKTLFSHGIWLCIWLNIISFLTSLALFIPFGPLNGENTLIASFSSIVYMFVTATAFYYNAVMFQIVNKKEIEHVFDVLTWIILGVGCFQLVMLKIPSLSSLYNILNFADIFAKSDLMLAMGRICLTGSEPAVVGTILNIFLLPYILSQIIQTGRLKYKLQTLICAVFIFYTYSSTAYIGFLFNILGFIYFSMRQKTNKKLFVQIITAMSFIILVFLISGSYLWDNTTIGQKIQELLINKTTSEENLSTLTRYSTIRSDFHAFIHYPVTGVGNGNQGYFYNEANERALSGVALQWKEISNLLDGNSGIVSGGAFLPAFISGYGLLGIILLIIFIRRCVKYINRYPQEYGLFRYMYFIGGMAFLGISTASVNLDGNFMAIFIVSIPFMQSWHKEKK